ncbi:hypothetical protein TNCT_456981, partial [Trichonephila clavata]
TCSEASNFDSSDSPLPILTPLDTCSSSVCELLLMNTAPRLLTPSHTPMCVSFSSALDKDCLHVAAIEGKVPPLPIP